ncbi:uncharacterized protein DS421_2g52920 [Arachis hypogaea]|nr:uncharacterized protein DS421_2g52920 [Arachis hypogaea]
MRELRQGRREEERGLPPFSSPPSFGLLPRSRAIASPFVPPTEETTRDAKERRPLVAICEARRYCYPCRRLGRVEERGCAAVASSVTAVAGSRAAVAELLPLGNASCHHYRSCPPQSPLEAAIPGTTTATFGRRCRLGWLSGLPPDQFRDHHCSVFFYSKYLCSNNPCVSVLLRVLKSLQY